jgi:hypothetical protein
LATPRLAVSHRLPRIMRETWNAPERSTPWTSRGRGHQRAGARPPREQRRTATTASRPRARGRPAASAPRDPAAPPSRDPAAPPSRDPAAPSSRDPGRPSFPRPVRPLFPRSWSCGWRKSGVERRKGNHKSKIGVVPGGRVGTAPASGFVGAGGFAGAEVGAADVAAVRRIRRDDNHARTIAIASNTANAGSPANTWADNGTPRKLPAGASSATRYMIMKNGAWARPGRRPASGLAPFARYNASVSEASDAGSSRCLRCRSARRGASAARRRSPRICR